MKERFPYLLRNLQLLSFMFGLLLLKLVVHYFFINMESIYDRALLEVGDSGYFQKKFDVIYNMILPMFWIMAYFNIISALAVIPHTCWLPERPENISSETWKSKYIPTLKDATGQIKFDSCSIYIDPEVNNETKSCDKYAYDNTWYESTVPSYNNWVCKDELYVANLFSFSRGGEIVGSLFFGWFGDMYGRRLTYIFAMILNVIGRIISIVGSQSFVYFVSGCTITCLSSWFVVQSALVISMEISSPSRRATVATLRNASLSCGMCVMPFLYWWLRDWKIFMIVTTASQIPFLIFSWIILESPRWLWISGKSEECIKQLKRISKANKSKLSPDTEDEIRTAPSVGKTQSLGILALFSGWRLTMNTILQLLLSMCVTITYTMLIMSPGEKSDGNPFLESSWQAVAELPGYFVGAWLAERIGRRHTSASSFADSAFIWAMVAFRENSTNVWIRKYWIGTTLSFINRLFTTISYYIISLFNMELYPTCLRQSGMSLGNVLSSGGAAIAPYVLYLGRRVDPRLPGIILTGVSVVAIISSLLLPETLNAKLPETLQDAQVFGKGYCSVPKSNSQKQKVIGIEDDIELK